MPVGSSQDPKEIIDTFNRDNMIGAFVQYWTGDRVGRGKFSTTRGRADLLGGHTPVVWVAGEASCIALTHVEPLFEVARFRMWQHDCGHVEYFPPECEPADGGCDACESGSDDPQDWRRLYVRKRDARPLVTTGSYASETDR